MNFVRFKNSGAGEEPAQHQNCLTISFVLICFQGPRLKLNVLKVKNMQSNPFLAEILLMPVHSHSDTRCPSYLASVSATVNRVFGFTCIEHFSCISLTGLNQKELILNSLSNTATIPMDGESCHCKSQNPCSTLGLSVAHNCYSILFWSDYCHKPAQTLWQPEQFTLIPIHWALQIKLNNFFL